MKKVLNFGDKKVVIKFDNDLENPRTAWEHNNQCIFFHRNYDFGDKHNIDADDYEDFDAMEKALYKEHGALVVLPVYMYDHSGITIKTSPFGCNWDSGKLGFIVAYKEEIRKSYGVKRISAKLKERVTELLESEIKVLDQYLRGDIFSFLLLDSDNEIIDSCSGFYGDEADNGIFDNLGLKDLSFEEYEKEFNKATWEQSEYETYEIY